MVRRLFPFCWAVFCLALLATPASAQTADDVTRELARLRTQIDQERKSIAQDSARQAQWRSQSKARHASMRSETVRLSRERDSLRESLDRSSRPKAPVAAPVTPLAARKKAFAEALANEIEKTIPLLSRELDHGAELPDQWARLAKGLQAGSEDPSEALGMFLDDLSERIDIGSRISSHVGTFTDAAGKASRGTFLDVGGCLQLFVAREGRMAAMKWHGESNMRELANPVEIAALAQAARILNGESDPAWLYLPAQGAKP